MTQTEFALKPKRPGFHVAPLANSPAQMRVYAFLHDRGRYGATTAEINELAHVQNVATWMSALRHNGVDYVRVCEGENGYGARVHRYWLKEFYQEAP